MPVKIAVALFMMCFYAGIGMLGFGIYELGSVDGLGVFDVGALLVFICLYTGIGLALYAFFRNLFDKERV